MTTNLLKVGFYYSKDVGKTEKKEIEDAFEKKGIRKDKNPQLIIVVGGDGSLLKSEQLYPKTPKLPIAHSSLGFLSEYGCRDLEEVTKLLKEKKYWIQERMKLSCDYGNKKYDAVNDIVIVPKETGMSLEHEVYEDNKRLFKAKGDGLIIFTPTGSTAYSLSCGGPLLKSQNIGLTLINPHLFMFKSIILPKETKITIKTTKPAKTVIDGQIEKETQKVTITKSKETMKLVTFSTKTNIEKVLKTYKRHHIDLAKT